MKRVVALAVAITCASSAVAALPPPPQPQPKTPIGMASIPGGALEGVQVAPFFLDRTEVTVAEYEACAIAGACAAADRFDPNDVGVFDYNRRLCNTGKAGRDDHPVNCVDWKMAVAYCAWRGARLPTRDELKWAAQSGDWKARFPWGDDAPDATRANGCDPSCVRDLASWGLGYPGFGTPTPMGPLDDGFPETAPVGSFPRGANRWGVLDLAGNALEWTATLTAGGAITRGGGWESAAEHLEARWEIAIPATRRFEDLGFRCARSK